jgi:predicted esterase
MHDETFAQFYDRVMEHYQEQRFGEALELLIQEGGRYPEEEGQLLYLSSCLATRVGRPAAGLAFLQTALERGYWYGEATMRRSPSWQPLQGNPEFERLAAISIERQRQAAGIPERFIELPPSPQPLQPLLIALHGNGDRGSAALNYWRAAAQEGWLTVAIQSSQAEMSSAFSWNDQELALREVAQHYAELRAHYDVDERRVVIAGFSMGGAIALRAILEGVIPATGFILLGPGGPPMDLAENWLPDITAAQPRGLRGSILLGEADQTIPQDEIRGLVGLLNDGGIPCELKLLPGLAHEYPDNPETVTRALDFVTR